MSYVLAAITTNLGRGEDAEKFKANVMRVLEANDRAVICAQEIDEADGPDEHAVFAAAIDPHDHRIGWQTYEPIVVPWMLRVIGQPVVTMAAKGLAKYTPTRFIVEARIKDPAHPEVPAVVVMNQHPPINRPATASRRRKMRRKHKARINYWYRRGVTVVWCGDMNDTDYPRMHRAERTAVHAGLDYIRFINAPGGAYVTVLGTEVIDTTIDAHNAHLARLKLTPKKETP